ncbi:MULTISPECIES: pyridoxamine 5'-phosphate oxidase family protein [unclassified Methanothermobacter]|uniref:pyridoxamine 5'-phosphate oxidase family protein n=1 Tax=Methanothermobacter TaxID=145260 RepID=UPI0011CA88C2|nr:MULTISPECIES: pyridoxamine 5'-phosphate oxidase family protein [unclassified Methanothermobacter]MCG2828418.1 pyridoxamine 5'-phosphate oxidase family protein [Methanothermobacter sp. K4]QEF93738.1 flavin-nucleotide-binding protein [Methanothermobacter sp. KEPCO-1]QHN08811.1 flavin-nucleotide-binding protein [Methanothermobacter sp. THM-2]
MMSREMMDAIEKELVFVATADEEGTPNVVPIGFARPLDEKTILIADNYMKKTIRNLHENPKMALIPQNARECPYQFKGTVEIFKSGKYFDMVVEWAQNVMTELEPKSAILMTVEEIYSVKPGPEAGEKVA